MGKTKFFGFVLRFAQKFKPLLVWLFPIRFLRGIKRSMVGSVMDNLNRDAGTGIFERAKYPDGVNLIGYVRIETGLGESCRLVANSIEMAKIPFTVYDYKPVGAISFNDASLSHKVTNTTPYNINIIHIHTYELPLAYIQLGKEVWDCRYNIGYWVWEAETFPQEWENAFLLVDEIWTPSEFASKSIRKATSKPVFTMPCGIKTPECGNFGRDDFGLPGDKFLFLCMYDSTSMFERKNPLGAIEAYKLAFKDNSGDTGLVIKINNAEQKDITCINESLAGYPNIYILTGTFDRIRANALIASVDVYVSLHRAEGFGLVMAEAMLLGVPVIATNWSSNTEFMDGAVACMVDYGLTELKTDIGPFKKGTRWADPNPAHAAEYMVKLYGDATFRSELAKKAKSHAKEHLAPERTAALFKKRLEEIYETKGNI